MKKTVILNSFNSKKLNLWNASFLRTKWLNELLIPPARSLREQSKLNLTVKFSKNKELAMGVATTSAVLDDEVI
jgi:hypothetical protein